MVDIPKISPIIESMELEGGYDSVEERDFFQWLNAEYARVRNDKNMSQEESSDRRNELTELHSISQPNRHPDTIPYFVERYVTRLKSGRNYYSQRPLHWTSSTVK